MIVGISRLRRKLDIQKMKSLLRKNIATLCRRMRMSGVLPHGTRTLPNVVLTLRSRTIHSADSSNSDAGGDEAVFNATPGSFWERESRLPFRRGLTHFEVKTVSASRPPSEPCSIVLLKRTSAAVAMASFI